MGALEESAFAIRAVLRHASVGIALVDREGLIVAANDAECRFLGYPREELVGLHYSHVADPVEQSGAAERFRRLLDGTSDGYIIDRRHVRKDGAMALGRLSVSPVRSDAGDIQGVVVICEDITESARTEAALRQSEERYRTLVETQSEAVCRWLPDTTLTFVNDGYCRYFGHSREELIGRRWIDLVPGSSREDVARFYEELARSPRPYTYVHEVTGADGQIRWQEWIDSPVLDRDGAAIEFQSVGRDVTERRRAEAALRESEARFRQAFENSPIGIALVGLDERMLEVNEALCRILGYSRERLLAMTIRQVTHPDDLAAEKESKSNLAASRSSAFAMAKRYVRADGNIVWGQLAVTAIRDEAGAPLYYLGQLEDITERVHGEEAIRRREETFRTLIEKSADLLLVLDAETRITYAGPSALDSLGARAEALLGTPMTEYVHDEDRGRFREELQAILREPGSTHRMRLRLRHADGSWRIFDAIERSLLHLPDINGIVVNGRDITEQTRLEEQIWQAQKLESIGRLAGGIAHDFNNLLTAILGYSEILEEDIRDGRPDVTHVGEIHKAADRARDLTAQLLAFARKQTIAPRVLDLTTLIRDSEHLLRRLLGEDVELVTDLASGLWPIRADAAQIQQVIVNLAVNARDAMPGGGRLTIESRNVDLESASAIPGMTPGPHVLLQVRDNGRGMSPETLSHLFEPFFTTKAAGKGTGLGLATAYGIVTQNGGQISVSSALGQGTTFRIRFPRCDGSPDARPVPPVSRPIRGTETVLIVEDDPGVRQLAAQALEQSGYRALVAPDGMAAMQTEAAEPGAIHLLLVDFVMPGMGGNEVAEELARRRPGLRVLYMSGYGLDRFVGQGAVGSDVDFLSKPFAPSSLVARVREILDRAPPRAQR